MFSLRERLQFNYWCNTPSISIASHNIQPIQYDKQINNIKQDLFVDISDTYIW